MNTMILFGAGTSVKAGVPDAYDMTKRLLEIFASDPRYRKYHRVLTFIIGGLLFQKGKTGKNPFDGVNVEDVFNAILLLADRQALEMAPFVGSWDSMVDLLDKSTTYNPNVSKLNEEIYKSISETISKAFPSQSASFSESKVDSTLQKAIESLVKGRNPSGSSSLGRAIHDYLSAYMKKWFDEMHRKRPVSSSSFGREFTRAIQANDELPAEGKVFEQTAELMIVNLINLVWIKDSHKIDYLSPLADLLKCQKQLCIATLNYDNTIELFAETSQVNYSTGIDGWSQTGEFRMEDDGIFLLKLHGSINWKLLRDQRSLEKPMPHSRIQIASPEDAEKEYYRPAVIFGQRNKLTAEGPFLDLIRAYQNELTKTDRVLIAGYSFRDPHINEYLTQWLNNKKDAEMVVIDPYIENSENEYIQCMKAFIREPRFKIIKEKVEDALPKLCQTTNT